MTLTGGVLVANTIVCDHRYNVGCDWLQAGHSVLHSVSSVDEIVLHVYHFQIGIGGDDLVIVIISSCIFRYLPRDCNGVAIAAFC